MPTMTIKVPTETAARLARLAARRRVSKSAVLREALEEKLRKSPEMLSLHESMRHTIGVLASSVSDLGHNPRHLASFGRR